MSSNETRQVASDGQIVVRRDGPVVMIGIDRVAKLSGFRAVMLKDLAQALRKDENLAVWAVDPDWPKRRQPAAAS